MGSPLLELDGVTVRFGSVTALDDVTFDVANGELLAVIGPNGAGKSSLFNVLSRVYRPSEGRVLLDGGSLLDLPRRTLAHRGVARSFQNLGVFGDLTALENVLVGRHHLMRAGVVRSGLNFGSTRRDERAHRDAALEALRFVGAEKEAHMHTGVLPYGVQKRIEVARCLAQEPRLLLLDEPVAGMSREERVDITELIQRLHAERALTVVLVEHDMGMVMQVADRVVVLDHGRVLAVGEPAQIQSDDRVIRAYLGEAAEAVG